MGGKEEEEAEEEKKEEGGEGDGKLTGRCRHFFSDT